MGLVRWYIDASYTTHEDCQVYTGAIMTMGNGTAISISRKQKTNARSSTEAELIGVYNELSRILHAQYSLKAMGYRVKNNVIYQDNKSSIMLKMAGHPDPNKQSTSRFDIFIKGIVERGGGDPTLPHKKVAGNFNKAKAEPRLF